MSRRLLTTQAEPIFTSFPVSPVDGQVVNILVDANKGIVWRFRYRAASTSAYKWEFIGGPSLSVRGTGVFSTAATSYVDVGVNVTFPLAGDYRALQSGRGGTSALGNRIYTRLSVVGGGSVSNNDLVLIGTANTSNDATDKNLANECDVLSAVNGATIRFQAMVNAAYTVFIAYAGISIVPIRCA